MCGIMGIWKFKNFTNNNKTKNLVKKLLLNIESRGRDATGLSLVNTNENTFKVIKNNVNATEFIKDLDKINFKDYNLILGHTRFKTQGTEENNKNNHPHFNKLENNCLIHNGVLYNYDEVKNKYHLELSGECDSEIILSLFNKFKGKIGKTLKKLSGNFAIGLYSHKKLYLYKDNNPLNIIYDKKQKMFLFSSHEDIFKELYNLENEKTEFHFFKNNATSEDIYYKSLDNENLMVIDFKTNNIGLTSTPTKSYTYVQDDYKPLEKKYFSEDNYLIDLKEMDDKEEKVLSENMKTDYIREQEILNRHIERFMEDNNLDEEDLTRSGYSLDDIIHFTPNEIDFIQANKREMEKDYLYN